MNNEEKYFENIKSYKFLAKHEVGQNFLIDSVAARKIVSLLELSNLDKVLEIGPGAGSLSFFLNCDNVCQCDLVDIDEGLITKLKEDFKDNTNINPVLANALKWDFSSYTKIIGNLPYYITSSLLEKILISAKSLQKAVIMVQKEAYERIISGINSKDYSPLNILFKYRGSFKKESVIRKTSFVPAPHIDSIVFSFVVNKDSDIETAKRLYALTSSLFLHRRKTILNNLSEYLKQTTIDAADVLSKANILPSSRPETISLEAYLRLLNVLKGSEFNLNTD